MKDTAVKSKSIISKFFEPFINLYNTFMKSDEENSVLSEEDQKIMEKLKKSMETLDSIDVNNLEDFEKASELDSRNRISSILETKNQSKANKKEKHSKQLENDKEGFDRED